MGSPASDFPTCEVGRYIRFAEGLGGDLGGFYAPKVGGKALIVIDSSTNFKKTIQGTIAHELVHHLEKNAGYKEFAKFVMSRVKPEKKAEVEKKYTEFYSNKYAAEAKAKGMSEADAVAYVKEKISSEKFKSDVESEVVAKYVGQALNNEKLLKKYADKDKKFIAKVGEWLFEKVKTLRKNKDKATAEEQESYKETIKVAEEMAAMVAALAQETDIVGESKSGVKYSVAGAENEESNSIKDQLKKSNDKLASMTPIKSKETPRTFKNAKEALEWAVEVLKSSGEVIQRKGYGEVVLDEKRLKNGLTYLKTDMEKVAFSLVPKVIKNGIEIGRHPKHKDRIYDTVTFASPVTVGDTTGYMAVVIREEGKNYFKLHRVFMPDGSLFEFQETKRSNAETAGLRNANLSPTNVTSINSIHQNEPIVNSSAKKDAEYLSAVERGDMETAQRMVDEAAKRAMPNSVLVDSNGNLIKMYHGSPETFNVFKGKEMGSTGNYFSPWKAFAEQYGEVRAFYVNLVNPVIYDYEWNKLNDVKEKDADGLIYTPEDIENGVDQDQIGDTEVVVYGSKGIKLADPVTYDDNGKVIPLSQRFNEAEDDIRYDLAEEPKRKAKTVEEEILDENGEVKDEYFAAAVMRMYERDAKAAQNSAEAYKIANQRAQQKLAESERKYKQLVSEGIKQHNFDFVEIENLRAEMRELGYNFELERRRSERLLEQVKKQKDMLKEAKQENRELAMQIREAEFIQQVNTREAAKAAEKLAKQRADVF